MIILYKFSGRAQDIMRFGGFLHKFICSDPLLELSQCDDSNKGSELYVLL